MLEPVVREVYGLESEFVNVAFRLDLPANSRELYVMELLDYVLSNGRCGLIDLNVNQKHTMASGSAYMYSLCDNSAYVLSGRPNEGQSLEEVKELLLEQLQKVVNGEFDEQIIEAAVNNIAASEMRKLQSNHARANAMANAFENDIDWYYASQHLEMLKKVTKEDVVKFAKRMFSNDNYVVVYKRQGEPAPTEKVTKPAITAIQMNRDAESDYFKAIKENKVKPIEPVFVDYQNSITFDQYKKVPIRYLQNEEDQTFTLCMLFPAGELNNILLPYAARYLNALGTDKMSVEAIKTNFYTMACSYNIIVSDDETYIMLNGIEENRDKAFKLMMEVINQAQADTVALKNMVEDVLLQRRNAKSSQNSVMNCLRNYAEYGPALVNYQLTTEQLQQLNGDTLLAQLRQLLMYQPEILYYGPATAKQVKKSLSVHYKLPKQFETPAPALKFERLATPENVVYYAPYPAKQSRVITYMRSEKFNLTLNPIVRMYNQYFGGSMNSIVFQEMREKRSLAYSAQSSFVLGIDTSDYMYNYSYIATQNDKIVDALVAFDSLFNAMPVSEAAFELAKEGAKNGIATNRISKMAILNNYLSNRKMGADYDIRKDYYNLIDGFTMADVQKFNQQYIKDNPKTYMILATEGEVDLEEVGQQFGTVHKLTLEDIFGY